LDLSHLEARELFLELIKISDVVVENFTPRVMNNWDLSYDRLKEVNAELIMLSMSGMGQTGTWKDFVTFGPTLQSLGGLTYLTSYSQDDPIGLGNAYADLVSGLYGVMAILAALEYRDRTGHGQYIDLSEYEAVCTTIGPALMEASHTRNEILPKGNAGEHINAVPYGCYKCLGEDRWCVIAVYNDDEWNDLCAVMGNPTWAMKDKFSTPAKRKMHVAELDTYLKKWSGKQTAEEIVKLLKEAGISSGVVQNAEDLSNDPQLLARDFFAELKHPALGTTKTDKNPIKFRGTKQESFRASPLLGEANHYVFQELLGLSEDDILLYRKKGIIA
jgi:crotonobetainyl-CoA:carnitine CoA-transferase CaiB-like acyl-CoA transferase